MRLLGKALKTRRLEPEIMDRPGLDENLHRQALRALGRINRLSGTSRLYWPTIEAAARRCAPRPLRVVDIACGGGEVAIELAARAQRLDSAIEINACDTNPFAIAEARRLAEAAGLQTHFFEHNALEPMPSRFDVIVCSLFLHHLTDSQAVTALRHLQGATRDTLVISDLRRGRLGYGLAFLASRLLTRSPVVRVDALRSVAAAFTTTEAAALARASGLAGTRVESRFPQRFSLIWTRT